MAIDLRHIQHAQALAQNGSFSRAAEALAIAQPTLSRSIKQLEDEIGLELFSRQRQGVEPTDFGYMFLQQAALVVAQVADLEHEVALAKGLQKGEVSVGFGPYAAEALLPASLPSFTASHPSVSLRIQVDSLETLARNLRARSADLIVGEASLFEADDSVENIAKLAPIHAFLLVRARHPLASKSKVSVVDALHYPFVQIVRLPPRVLKPILAGRRMSEDGTDATAPPFPAVECPTVPLGVSAITDSNAVMLANLGAVRRELEDGRIVPIVHEPWMRSDWAIMRLRRRSLAPAAMAFVAELMRSHAIVRADDAQLCKRWAKRLLGNSDGTALDTKSLRRRSSR